MSKRSSQSPRAKAHTLAASPSSKKMKNRTSSKLLHDDESFLNSNLAAAYLNNKTTKNAPANNQNEHLMLMSDLDLEDSMTLMSPIRPASRSVTIGNIAEGSYFKVLNIIVFSVFFYSFLFFKILFELIISCSFSLKLFLINLS